MFWKRSLGYSDSRMLETKKFGRQIRVLTQNTRNKQWFEWYDYMERMPDNRWAKNVLNWDPIGKRKRARCRRVWKVDIYDEDTRDSTRPIQSTRA